MTTTTDRPSSTHARRPTAMYLGLALTIFATLAPLLDIATVDTLSDHVRGAYADWSSNLVAKDRNAIAIYLVVTGALGIMAWLLTIWSVTAGKRWARAAATIAFAVGTLVALTNLTTGGDHYDTIIPLTYGTLTLLPCIAGLVAVVSAWRPPSTV